MKKFCVAILAFFAAITLLMTAPASTHAGPLAGLIDQPDRLVSQVNCLPTGFPCSASTPPCCGATSVCLEGTCHTVSQGDCQPPESPCDPFGKPCCEGSMCREGLCIPQPPKCKEEGDACSAGEACCRGMSCIQGRCNYPGCVELGAECSNPDSCCSGAFCADTGEQKVCSYCTGIGQPCGFNSSWVHCCNSLTCEPVEDVANNGGAPGICRPPCSGLGQPCGSTDSSPPCCSGLECGNASTGNFDGKCILPF